MPADSAVEGESRQQILTGAAECKPQLGQL
jgi:hypothetical protein